MPAVPTRLRDQWGAADGAAWGPLWAADDASAGSSSDTQTGQGRLRTGTAGGYSDSIGKPIAGPLPADFELTVDLIATDVAECYPRLHFRDRDGTRANSYDLQFEVAFNSVSFKRREAYTPTIDIGAGYTIGLNDVIHVRLRCVGPSIRIRLWTGAAAEPGTWLFNIADWMFLAPTQRRLVVALGGGPAAASRSCRWDNLDVRAIGPRRRSNCRRAQ